MSNAKILLPLSSELTITDVLALQEKKTIFPFNLSAKAIKVNDGMSLAEKYPFTLETDSGYTYSVVKDGQDLASIQLSNETGLEIKASGNAASKKLEPLLKVFFLDESRMLYSALLNQLTKLGNNQFFILLLGMKAQKLVRGDELTVNMITAPELKLITGDQWIELTLSVIKDISWGYFDKDVRPAIINNFENKLREVLDVELKMLGVNIPALEKAVSKQLKLIANTTVDLTPQVDVGDKLDQVQNANEQTIDVKASEVAEIAPFITPLHLKLPDSALLEMIKSVDTSVYEAVQLKLPKLKTPSQRINYFKDKGWFKYNEAFLTEDDLNLPIDELKGKVSNYSQQLLKEVEKFNALPQIKVYLTNQGYIIPTTEDQATEQTEQG